MMRQALWTVLSGTVFAVLVGACATTASDQPTEASKTEPKSPEPQQKTDKPGGQFQY